MIIKLKQTFLVLLLLTVAAIADPASSIVGSWLESSSGARWTFRADGTGFMELGETRTTARFNWRLRGSTLEVSTAATSVPYSVLQQGSDSLTIRNERVSQVYQLQRSH